MTWLWILVAFLVGWLACWKLSNLLMRKALRRDTYFQQAIESLPQDRLIKTRDIIVGELEKRRLS